MVVSSCGQSNPLFKKADKRPDALVLSEVSCEGDPSLKESNASKEVVLYFGRVYAFVNQYNQLHLPLLEGIIGQSANQGLSPLAPVFISEEVLKNQLSKIKLRLIDLLGTFNTNFLSDSSLGGVPLKIEEVEKVNKALKELNLLYQYSYRWQNHRCKLEGLAQGRSRDVRAFYEIDKNAVREKIKSYPQLSKLEKREVRKKMIALCLPFHEGSFCQGEFELSLFQGKLKAFLSNYLEKYKKERVDPIFDIKNPKKFNCFENSGVSVIEVPFFLEHEGSVPGGFAGLRNIIEAKWSTGKIRVRLIKALSKGPRVVSLKFRKSGLSYVDQKRPYEINMNQSLMGTSFLNTFAHEFGHILGFMDCYIEFYHTKEKRLIYYTLDNENNNLMCAIEPTHKAPEEYLEKLKRESCL